MIQSTFTNAMSSGALEGLSTTKSLDMGKGLQPGIGSEKSSGGTTFAQMFQDSLDKVNTFQVQSDTAIKELVAGRSKNIHETMLAIERADTSLKLMMQVRNKVLDAYREIMRMQI
jgi:flagellar hook-basal body complex protein FliE